MNELTKRPAREMFRRNRRLLLCDLSAVAIATTLPAPLLANQKRPADIHTLRRFLDVLIPADETPCATDIGIDTYLLDLARDIPNYPELLDAGCQWLDVQAQNLSATDFVGTDEETAIAIVVSGFAASPQSLAQVFTTRIRNDAMALYYARPESWPGLIDTPPQPLGYPNASQRPRPA